MTMSYLTQVWESIWNSEARSTEAGQERSSSPVMFVCLLIAWLVLAWRFDGRLWHILVSAPTLAGKLSVGALVGCLNLFWLIAVYHMALVLFTAISRYRREVSVEWDGDEPEIAILYTTMHDFQERAALSCVTQRYTNYRVFILDDSVDAKSIEEVDRFAERHRDRVTVVRRRDRRGFKAGSLNHALTSVASSAQYMAIADADSVLPPDFLRRTLPHFHKDSHIGWVQASHRPHPEQHSTFARDLCLGIVPLWSVYYGPKNRFGFVLFLGHGAVIRRDVWESIGGFPELVSEDLCFSTRAAQRGYRGFFAADVICYEDFPEGYRQLRRQQEKYVKGACQFVHRECRSFLASSRVAWHEKLDIVLSCTSLFTPIVHLVFLAAYCVCIPAVLGEWKGLTVQMFGFGRSFNVLTPGDHLLSLWSWDFYWASLACAFAPALCSIGLAMRYPIRGTKALLLSAVPYLSLMVVAAGAVLSYLASRQAVFLVTGDSWGAAKDRWPRGFSLESPGMERIGSEDRRTQLIELIIGLMLVVMCVATANIALLGLATAMGLGPVLLRARWEGALLRPLLYCPFLMVWAGMALSGPTALVGQGSFMNVFMFHF